MRWHISIFTTDGKRLIFAAKASRTEVDELAAEARRTNPGLQIYLRSPTGAVTKF